MCVWGGGGGGRGGGKGGMLLEPWNPSPDYVQNTAVSPCTSSTISAKDVSPEGTSATQQQKFPTDDIKCVQNLVRSSDWPT